MPAAPSPLVAAALASDRASSRGRWLTYALIVVGGAAFLAINLWYVVKTERGDAQRAEILRTVRDEARRMDAFVETYVAERRQSAKEVREQLDRIEKRLR